LQATKANLKALGFADLDLIFGISDAEITFSTNFNFDYDNSNGITPGRMDFESVAVHEIGHALGFISDVDFVDFVLDAGQVSNSVQPTTLDMYRFRDLAGNNPGSLANFSLYSRNLVPGHVGFFDQIDNSFGGSAEVRFATGLTRGDGQQASHWKDNLMLGVMDPTLSFGEISPLRANDVRAFDLIGYEIVIPEPRGAALWSLGAMAIAACAGRARANHCRVA